jgi:hypothetical protein
VTLRFFAHLENQHGFYYHFIDMNTGERANRSEISTVDTALLLAGMLFCQSYFDTRNPQEVEIRKLSRQIYERADWTWAQPRRHRSGTNPGDDRELPQRPRVARHARQPLPA